MEYDTMTPEMLRDWLKDGEESPPLVCRDGGYVTISRDGGTWHVYYTLTDPVTHRSQFTDSEHELFGILSALGPWEER